MHVKGARLGHVMLNGSANFTTSPLAAHEVSEVTYLTAEGLEQIVAREMLIRGSGVRYHYQPA